MLVIQAAHTRPLPLELTEPVELAPSLGAALREAYEAATRYNPVTQLRENAEGIPHFLDQESSKSEQHCETRTGAFVIDVTVDIQIDDNDIF